MTTWTSEPPAEPGFYFAFHGIREAERGVGVAYRSPIHEDRWYTPGNNEWWDSDAMRVDGSWRFWPIPLAMPDPPSEEEG